MKFGIITFPGSNCDQDMIYALSQNLKQQTVSLWHKDTHLQDCDAIVIPGGFSYGDYLRSGAIAPFSPIMSSVKTFAENGGLVLGVCNGFQILCESGLLPGALLHNTQKKFICKNVYIRPENLENPITTHIQKKALQIPIAHGEGNYYIDSAGLEKLKNNKQITFKYCNAAGEITTDSNPNGSLENIAGICNTQKNIFGMMPHPERATDPVLVNTDGNSIFQSLIAALSHTIPSL